VDPLPHPRIAVLLGGESAAFSFPPELATTLGAKLAALAGENGGSLLVTPSRRTRTDSLAALFVAIKDVPHIVWDGTRDNPYFAFLALADAIVATEDSVNMVTEAAGTGKPVYVQALKGSSRRLARFHALMQERGATRPSKAGSTAGPMRRSTTRRWSPPPFGARFTLKLKPKSAPCQPARRAACAIAALCLPLSVLPREACQWLPATPR